MKESFDDVLGKSNDWIEVYSTLGIAQGSAVVIQNKGCRPVLILMRAEKPSPINNSGYELHGPTPYEIPASSLLGLWIKGDSPVHVVVK